MLAFALTGAVLLVVDVVLGRPAGIAAGASVLVFIAGLWAALPWGLSRSLAARAARQNSGRR